MQAFSVKSPFKVRQADKSKVVLFLFFLAGRPFLVKAQPFQTFSYYQDESVKLELDLFLPVSSTAKKTPLLIFVHGGGFSGGIEALAINCQSILPGEELPPPPFPIRCI